MYVFEGKTDLHEHVENNVLGEDSALLVLDLGTQISAICEVHDNAEFVLLCLVDLAKADDVRVFKLLQDLGFLVGVRLFLLAEWVQVYLLDDAFGVVRAGFDQVALAKGTLAQRAQDLVVLSHFYYMQTRGKLHTTVSSEGKTKALWQLPDPASLQATRNCLASPCFLTCDGAAWQLRARALNSYVQLYLFRLHATERLKEFKVIATFRILREGLVPEVAKTTKVISFRPPAIIGRGFDEAIALQDCANHYVELTVSPMSNGAESRRETGYVGLCNEGNTCYINALLQTLYHLPCLRQAVFHTPSSSALAYQLQKVFYDLTHSPTDVSAKGLLRSLHLDAHHRQEDVQEFSLAFCERLKGCMQNSPVASFIPDLFEGVTETVFRCSNVSFSSAPRQEEFIDLQLPVANLGNVQNSLRVVMQEQLTGEEQFDAGDLGKQDAVREVRFRRLPPVLQLFLKRFQYKYGEIEKLNERFEFPEVLDLSPYMVEAEEAEYRLFGVLVHKGVSDQGHYYAFLKVGLADWYKFNDHSVDIVTAQQVFISSFGGKLPDVSLTADGVKEELRDTDTSAYMLYYIKQGQEDRLFSPEVLVPAELQRRFEGIATPEPSRDSLYNLSPEMCPASSPCKTVWTFKAPFLTLAGVQGWKGPGIYCATECVVPNDLQLSYMELQSNCTHSDLCAKLKRLNPGTEIRVWLFYPLLSRWQFRVLKADTALVQVVGEGKLTQLLFLETQENREIVTSGFATDKADSDADTLPDDCQDKPISPPLYHLDKTLVFLKIYSCKWGQSDLILCSAANINQEVVSVDSIRMHFCDLRPEWRSKPTSCFYLYLERCQEKTGESGADCVLVESKILARKKVSGAVTVANGDALIGEMREEEDSDYVPADIFLKKLVYYTSVKFRPYLSEEQRAFDLQELATKLGKSAEFHEEVPKAAKLNDILELLTARYRPALPSLVSTSVGIFAYDSKVRKTARLPHPTNLTDPGNNPTLTALYTDKAVFYAIDKPERRDSEPADLNISVYYICNDQSWDTKPLQRELGRSACVKELTLAIYTEVVAMWKCENDSDSHLTLEVYEHDLSTKAYKRKLGAHVLLTTLEHALLSAKVVIQEERTAILRKEKERVDLVVFSATLGAYSHPKYLLLPVYVMQLNATCREVLVAVKSLFPESVVAAVEPLILKPSRELRGPLSEDQTVYLTAFPSSEAQLQVTLK